jgi:hypothetical protein
VLPPGPVQVKVKVLVSVKGPTLSLPESGLLPDQAPPASQEVASVDDQVKVEEPFMSTVVGLAVSATVGNGAGFTATVTDRPALPPAPLQARVNALVAVRGPTLSLPEVAFMPDQAPPALQAVASVDDQSKVVEPFMSTVVGLAMSETLGNRGGGSASTATVTDCSIGWPRP